MKSCAVLHTSVLLWRDMDAQVPCEQPAPLNGRTRAAQCHVGDFAAADATFPYNFFLRAPEFARAHDVELNHVVSSGQIQGHLPFEGETETYQYRLAPQGLSARGSGPGAIAGADSTDFSAGLSLTVLRDFKSKSKHSQAIYSTKKVKYATKWQGRPP